ncbi:MAG: ribosome silencing factor [Bacteriovoracia bacterium]
MANEFLKNEIQNILNDKRWAFPLNHAMAATYVLAHYKGENLKVFDMQNGSAMCDYNIVATAQNPMQARAMADEIGRQFREMGTEIISFEGYGSADWILLDTGDVITHIFQENTRSAYDLDHVFGDRPHVKIPDEFYFAGAAAPKAEETLKGFF